MIEEKELQLKIIWRKVLGQWAFAVAPFWKTQDSHSQIYPHQFCIAVSYSQKLFPILLKLLFPHLKKNHASHINRLDLLFKKKKKKPFIVSLPFFLIFTILAHHFPVKVSFHLLGLMQEIILQNKPGEAQNDAIVQDKHIFLG